MDALKQNKVIRLKGSLISKAYNEIIHIEDQDDEFHINSFETDPRNRNEVMQYIEAFIGMENLSDTVSLK
ncbi:hypothetical protein [Flavobacterium sp. Root420]|uniref:hypothetical protein n=1 Tax=Flavobacterium sp. Root420 TaxID=1736533 RepID=UPI000B01A2DD